MAEILVMLSLAEVLQWPSLCKDVRKELQYAVKHELITEKEANYIMRRCGKYEERERNRNDDDN